MKRKNILFSACVVFIILMIVISLLGGIYQRANRKSISVSINPKQPVVALTFDDGPNSCYTPKILDILYDYQVPATFFLIGEKFAGNELFIKEIVASGHEIGSHTFSHPDLTTLNTKQMQQEFHQTEKELKKILPDYDIQYIRPPYGRYTEKVEKTSKLPLMLWTLDSKDWKNPKAEKIYSNVINHIKNEDIIVFHDNNAETVKALHKIIVELKTRGFQFLTVSQMDEMKKSRVMDKS